MRNTDNNTKKQAPQQTAGSNIPTAPHKLCMGIIAAITLIVFLPALSNQLTNWDDTEYVRNNLLLRDLSAAGLKNIFSTPVIGNYHPLTILSYALEYSIAGIEPWLYHLDNVLLHLLVSLCAYWLAFKLTGKYVVGFITAALFAIHPMHVESVAWVAGRKDVLYGVFYLAACIAHIYYTGAVHRRAWWYAAVLVLYVCALLSKPVAVTLPLALLLIDYYMGRPIDRRALLEKIPHFALALLAGLLAISTQRLQGAIAVQQETYNVAERIALGCYALCIYLWKAVLPLGLRCFYPYPPRVGGSLPVIYYASIIALAAIVYAVVRLGRRHRALIFGALFFLLHIVLLLQFLPVGDAIVAERYSYIAYFGLFFAASSLAMPFITPQAQKRPATRVIAVGAAFLLFLSYLSHQRTKVWYDSVSLWRDELKKEPLNARVAYENLGFTYFDKWNSATSRADERVYYDSALYIMTRLTELWPQYAPPYQPVAMLLYARRKVDDADRYFKKGLLLDPSPEGYANYGNFLQMAGKYDAALAAYETAVDQKPDLYAPYLNMGKIQRQAGRWPEAMRNLNRALDLNPNAGEIYYERSFCDTQLGMYPLALRDVEKAGALGYPKIDMAYYNLLKDKAR